MLHFFLLLLFLFLFEFLVQLHKKNKLFFEIHFRSAAGREETGSPRHAEAPQKRLWRMNRLRHSTF
jgi:hypothetical protein